jgi:hypothetical protein
MRNINVSDVLFVVCVHTIAEIRDDFLYLFKGAQTEIGLYPLKLGTNGQLRKTAWSLIG